MPRKLIAFVIVMLVTLVLDQGSKAWAHTLPLSSPTCDTPQLVAQTCGGVPQPVVTGYWDWELTMNPGAAFSSFVGAGLTRVALSLVATIAVVWICIAAWRSSSGERTKRVALALVAGGALGNLVDRLHYGAVTDFVRWRIGEHRWPIFNVADAALLVGAVMLILTTSSRRQTPASETASANLDA